MLLPRRYRSATVHRLQHHSQCNDLLFRRRGLPQLRSLLHDLRHVNQHRHLYRPIVAIARVLSEMPKRYSRASRSLPDPTHLFPISPQCDRIEVNIVDTMCIAFVQAEVNSLYRCSSSQWCCSAGSKTASCCNEPNVTLFGSTLSTIYNGSAFSSEYTLIPVAQLMPEASVMSVCKEANKAVGLRVGLGLGLPLLTALGALSLLLRRARRRSRKSRERADGALPGGGGRWVDQV